MTQETGLEERLAELEKKLDAPKRQAKRRFKPLLVVTSVAVAVLLAAGGFAYSRQSTDKPTSPFPASVRQSAHFPLYYPTNLPDGLTVDQASISGTEQAVTYTINQNNAPKYNVSIQAMPANFDFSAFKKKFQDGDEFSAQAGSVFIGDAGNGLIGSIRTSDGSWIILTTSDYAAKGQISELSRSFQKVPN